MSSYRSCKLLVTLLLSMAVVIYAEPSSAQTDSSAQQQKAPLDEIVVTSERRSESVQEVPVAINAFSNEQLERAGVQKVDDLTMLTPGVQIDINQGNLLLFIRGVGSNTSAAGNESSIAYYVDDVYYVEQSGMLSSMDNVERVEVLKGPQGTLFGRNATGGLIQVITPEPQAERSVKVKAGYESYNTVFGSLYATGALFEQVKGSLSMTVHHQDDGYGTNLFDNKDIQFARYYDTRGKLLWEPTDADRLTLSGSYYKDTSDLGFANTIYPGTTTVAATTYPGNFFDRNSNVDVEQDTEAKDVSLHWEHNFDKSMVFKSISAYREVDNHFLVDLDATPAALVASGVAKDQSNFQQEFLLQGSLLDQRLKYTTGIFYLNSKTYFPVVLYIRNLLPQPQPSWVTTKSIAGYGQADYQFTDRDTLTAGVRYTSDHQGFRQTEYLPGGAAVLAAVDATKKYQDPSWRLSWKHDFSDELMAYFSYNRGFKSGGFNATYAAASGVNSVKPETLDAYEMGLKGTFLDRRLQLSASTYYYHYKDLQVTIFQGTGNAEFNAAGAQMYGVELQGALAVPVPLGDLRVDSGFSWIKDKYTTFKNCPITIANPFPPGGGTQISGDCSGNRLLLTPDWDFTVSPNYSVPVPRVGGDLALSMTYYHSDGFYFASDNLTKQGPYDQVNAEIAYTFPRDRTTLRVYGRNITDALVVGHYNQSTLNSDFGARPPRTIGVSIETKW